MDKKQNKDKIKIGLALGSGGAKGLAHLGILKVLERHNIEIDLIAGSSMGSVIGAGYAAGLSIEELEKKALKFFSETSMFSPRNFHFFHESLIRPQDIKDTFYDFVGDKNFEETKIPFVTLALDLESGKEVRLDSGPLLEAIEASSAIPGVFPPVFINGRYLVDGGLLNSTPVDYLRDADMDVVVGVYTTNVSSKQYISGMVWEKYYSKPQKFKGAKGLFQNAKNNMMLMIHILLRTIEISRKINTKIKFLKARPDIVVHPYTEDVGTLQFERCLEIIKYGEDAMEKEMPRLLKIIEQKKKLKEDSNN